MRSRLFIGSSSESLDVARAVQANLDSYADCTIWNQGSFGLSKLPVESLIAAVTQAEFAAFIVAADDLIVMRGAVSSVSRDNVIFELGLSVGLCGLLNTFLITQSGVDLHLPTDLLGITSTSYRADRADGNLYAALGPASFEILGVIRR